jgi:hypothetical protein
LVSIIPSFGINFFIFFLREERLMGKIKIFVLVFFLTMGITIPSFANIDEGYQLYLVEGVDAISKEKEIVKTPFIGTLAGITQHFTGGTDSVDLKNIAELNGLNFSPERYRDNDPALWLYKGGEVKIPDSFLKNLKSDLASIKKSSQNKNVSILSQGGYKAYRVEGMHEISREIKKEERNIIKTPSIGTLTGITRYFTGRVDFADLKRLAELNNLVFNERKYSYNDEALWLRKGQKIRVPDSFFENLDQSMPDSLLVLAETEKIDKKLKVTQKVDVKTSELSVDIDIFGFDDPGNEYLAGVFLEEPMIIANNSSGVGEFDSDVDVNDMKKEGCNNDVVEGIKNSPDEIIQTKIEGEGKLLKVLTSLVSIKDREALASSVAPVPEFEKKERKFFPINKSLWAGVSLFAFVFVAGWGWSFRCIRKEKIHYPSYYQK